MILAMILGSYLNSLAAGLRKKIARRRATEEGQHGGGSGLTFGHELNGGGSGLTFGHELNKKSIYSTEEGQV
jgi:hypothetical protein